MEGVVDAVPGRRGVARHGLRWGSRYRSDPSDCENPGSSDAKGDNFYRCRPLHKPSTSGNEETILDCSPRHFDALADIEDDGLDFGEIIVNHVINTLVS